MRLIFIALLFLSGCANHQVYQQQRYVFGTLVEVSIYGKDKSEADAAIDSVMRKFSEMHVALHAWKPSEVTALNEAFREGKKEKITPDLETIIVDATRLSDRSKGLFNPAIGNLIKLWGFQNDEFKPVKPDPEEIRKLVQAHPVMDDITIENGTAYSKNPAVRLDFGGFAKGYALDVAAKMLHKAGVEDALINIGGNIMALGRHGDRPWRVGIQNPRGPGAIAELDLKDGEAIGTSGDYQRYFILDGKRYCHIIDPRTGYPAQGVEAVTVLIPKGAHAGALSDADSKPLFISGVNGWREAAREMGVENALLIDSGGKVHITKSFGGRIHFEKKEPGLDVVD